MSDSHRPVALVTGASAGIGRVFCAQLAARGYDLVLVARDEGRLVALRDEFARTHGTSSEVLPADLSRDEEVTRVVARMDASPVDLLVNNAGFATRGSLARTSREGQDTMVRLHVLATHRLTQAAVAGMVARGRGAVITVSSVASYLTSGGNVNYAATKAYQRLYVESLARELSGTGVYAQALCPGFTHTEFHARGGLNKNRYPAWAWMDADRVVSTSLAALDRRSPTVVVPGRLYRVAVFLLRFLPRWLLVKLTTRYRRDTPASASVQKA